MIVILCSKNVLLHTEPSVLAPVTQSSSSDLMPIKRILGYIEVRSML